MADDLQNYKLQLQQVEAALLTDHENTELLKLQQDLEEVIALTRDLIKTQLEEQKKSSYVEPVSSTSLYDEVEQALLAAERLQRNSKPQKSWKIGDKCQAKWTEDGQYYDATIEGITSSGEVSVMFEAYQNRSTTILKELKERVIRNEVFPSNSNKRHRPNQKEYLKKKKQKKQQRFKDLEEERESEKNKWLNFTTKTTKKSGNVMKGKSIFASPDNISGRVGIGTCGKSGRPMTKNKMCEKWRKGI